MLFPFTFPTDSHTQNPSHQPSSTYEPTSHRTACSCFEKSTRSVVLSAQQATFYPQTTHLLWKAVGEAETAQSAPVSSVGCPHHDCCSRPRLSPHSCCHANASHCGPGWEPARMSHSGGLAALHSPMHGNTLWECPACLS